jgi:chaperonin GroES
MRRKTMKVKPLHDWAVIRPSEPAEKTAGGLFIPDSAKDKPQEGLIEAIGPGALEEEKRDKKKDKKKERRFVPTVVKPGDRVAYGRYAGGTYIIDGEERVLVRERDILGILPGPLQIPASTASTGGTALMKSVAQAPAGRPRAAKQTVVKKTVAKKKAVKKKVVKKKVAKKTKKAEKKAAKKPGAKKKITAAKSSKTAVAKGSAKGKKAGKKK